LAELEPRNAIDKTLEIVIPSECPQLDMILYVLQLEMILL